MNLSSPSGTDHIPVPQPGASFATPDDLFARLAELDIAYTLHHHRAVFTVAEAETIEHDIPGTHCRNLFLKDHKGRMFLVSLRNRTLVDIKKLQGVLGCGRLSFGSADRLYAALGVLPGSVCAFAVMNDSVGAVTLVLESEMMDDQILTFHPLINTMTVGISPADLVRFARATGHEPIVLPCAGLGHDDRA